MGRRRNWDRVRKENLVRLRGAESILEPQPDVEAKKVPLVRQGHAGFQAHVAPLVGAPQEGGEIQREDAPWLIAVLGTANMEGMQNGQGV